MTIIVTQNTATVSITATQSSNSILLQPVIVTASTEITGIDGGTP